MLTPSHLSNFQYAMIVIVEQSLPSITFKPAGPEAGHAATKHS